jgi:hypothetical protein
LLSVGFTMNWVPVEASFYAGGAVRLSRDGP